MLVLCALAIVCCSAQSYGYESPYEINQWDKHQGNMNHDFGIQK